MKILRALITLCLFQRLTTLAYRHEEDLKAYLQKSDGTNIIDNLVIGSLGIYLSMFELEDLMQSIIADYKQEVVYDFILGESKEGRPINGYAFMLGTDSEHWE